MLWLFLLFTACLGGSLASKHEAVVITAYFPIDRSTHPKKHYQTWSRTFFSNISAKTYVFTTPQQAESFRNMFNEADFPRTLTFYEITQDEKSEFEAELNEIDADVVFVTAYDKVSKLPPVRDIGNDPESWHHELNPEADKKEVQLYQVWTSKPWFVNRVASLGLFAEQTVYFWVDVGSMRKGDFPKWPQVDTVKDEFGKLDAEKPVLVAVTKGKRSFVDGKLVKAPGKYNCDFIIGGYFACKKIGCAVLASDFYKARDQMQNQGLFFGKEQDVMDWMVMKHPERFYSLDLSNMVQSDWNGAFHRAFYAFFAEAALRKKVLNPKYEIKIVNASNLVA